MKKIISILLCFCFIGLFPVSAKASILSGQAKTSVVLNSGFVIPVSFAQSLNSKNIKSGDMLPIIVEQNVYVDNKLVFKKGAPGVAFVDEAKSARSFGRAGMISVQSGKVADVTGTERSIGLSTLTQGEQNKAGVILPIVSLLILWPLAFFAFKKGDNVIIPAGKPFNAILSSQTTLSL